MQLSIKIDDASHVVTVKPADLIAFERKYGLDWTEASEHPKIEHVFFLGWNAARRSGLTTDDFDTWLDQVDDIDPVEEEVPLAPTSAN